MKITALDHLVLTVQDIEKTLDFYINILGMKKQIFGENRVDLCFGQQKINLHQKGKEILPNAKTATCGSADICLLTDTPLTEIKRFLEQKNIPIIDGIVPRTGAMGAIDSIYIRDPDGNLIEINQYVSS